MTKRWTVILLAACMLTGGAYVIAKPMIPTPAAMPVLGELEPVLQCPTLADAPARRVSSGHLGCSQGDCAAI